MSEQTSSSTLERFGAYLDRLSEQPPDVIARELEAAIDRRLAKKLGCAPEEVDSVLARQAPAIEYVDARDPHRILEEMATLPPAA